MYGLHAITITLTLIITIKYTAILLILKKIL